MGGQAKRKAVHEVPRPRTVSDNTRIFQCSHDLVHKVMPHVGLSEFDVLTYVFLRTIGFKKEWAEILLTEMLQGYYRTVDHRHPNISPVINKNKRALQKNLKDLIDRDILLAEYSRGRIRKFSIDWCTISAMPSGLVGVAALKKTTPKSSHDYRRINIMRYSRFDMGIWAYRLALTVHEILSSRDCTQGRIQIATLRECMRYRSRTGGVRMPKNATVRAAAQELAQRQPKFYTVEAGHKHMRTLFFCLHDKGFQDANTICWNTLKDNAK